MAKPPSLYRVSSPTVLIADEDQHLTSLLDHHLTTAGFHVTIVHNGRDAITSMSDEIQVALLNLFMPGINGMECLRWIQAYYENTEVIIMTTNQNISEAVEAMKAGAFDYVEKPLNFEAVCTLVTKATLTSSLKTENRMLKQVLGNSKPMSSFIGDSKPIRKILKESEKIALQSSPILITGEIGVGKSLLARQIHYQSHRTDKPFVTLNCTALPHDLVEAELFGYEKSAFDGASEDRPGRIEIADGGTLLLDQVEFLPYDLQFILFNFLQEKTFYRLGGTQPVHADVRIIGTTHQNLQQWVLEKRFREDLFLYLNANSLHIPPLKERPTDISILTEYLLKHIAQHRNCPPLHISPQVRAALEHYSWPENVRELENVLEHTTAFCRGLMIEIKDLPQRILHPTPPKASIPPGLGGLALEEVERMAIEQTLLHCDGNKAKASRQLGISEKSIYNKMKRLGISG